jgi:5-methylcytosine-specific restriction endonuclease McrA
MPQRNSKIAKRIRQQLIAISQPPACFYCGLPFHTFLLPRHTPGAARSRRYASITLEHLVPQSHGGDTTLENCVLAHLWCNNTASDKSLLDKLELKATLSAHNGYPPWWSQLQRIIQNQTI